MKKIKVGVIGTGVMGGFHASQYKNIPKAELVGIYDKDGIRAKGIADKCHVAAFDNLEKLLEMSDALSIATPTTTHYSVGMACLDAGKHIIIEKPITTNTNEAESLINKAKMKGLVLAAGHIERFNPAYNKFKVIIKEFGINKINTIDVKRLSPYPERITDASVVLDIMIHDIDLVMDLVDSKIANINAKGETIRSKSLDKVVANITFQNGIIANIEADRLHDNKVRSFYVRAQDRSYEIDLIKKEIIERKEHSQLKIDVSLYDQLQVELADFIDSIIEDRMPVVSGEQGLEVLKVAQRIEEIALKS